MTEKDKDLFASISLPLVRQSEAKSILNEIDPVQPMTIEQAANGRPIQDFPYKLDDFVSYEALEAFIRGKLKSVIFKNDDVRWLAACMVNSMQFPSDTVYYRPVAMIQIAGVEPVNTRDYVLDQPRSYQICKLNPKNWNLNKIIKIIKKIKQEHVLPPNK